MASAILTAKHQAHEVLARLPDDASWDKVIYELVVRRAVERGLADADAGRVVEIADIRREFGLAD